MVAIECNLSLLQKLVGKELREEELEEILWNLGFEVESKEEESWKIDITPDRPDMFSVFGIAREIRNYLGLEKKEIEFKEESKFRVIVEESVKDVRPYTVCAVIKKLNLNEEILKSLIQLQEKIHLSYARKRKKAAIGIYPLEKIAWPIRFLAREPEKIRFVPLDSEEEMNGKEILEKHEKGKEYKHLLEGKEKYPIFEDAEGKILSMPPIINSNETGKVELHTKEVFIEVSGFDLNFLNKVLNLLISSFIEIGEVYRVEVDYKDKKIKTPLIETKEVKLDLENANKILGINVDKENVKKLLEKMGYEFKEKEDYLIAIPPWYRVDIFSEIDVIEDLAKSYGIFNFKPEFPKIPTLASYNEKTKSIDAIRNLLIGYGFQELYSLILTGKKEQFNKMHINEEKNAIEIKNAQESSINMARVWILPEILRFLSRNQNQAFPIKVFEVGEVLFKDEEKETKAKEEMHLGIAILNSKVGYGDLAGVIATFFKILGKELKFEKTEHKSFIEGRVAKVLVEGKEIGVIGELHPKVLKNFNLEFPVVGGEIDLSLLLC